MVERRPRVAARPVGLLEGVLQYCPDSTLRYLKMHHFNDARVYRALTFEYMRRIARFMRSHRMGPRYAFESICHANMRRTMQQLSALCLYVGGDRSDVGSADGDVPAIRTPKMACACLMRSELLRPIHCELKWAKSLLRRRRRGAARVVRIPLHAAYRLQDTEIGRIRAQAPQVLALIY